MAGEIYHIKTVNDFLKVPMDRRDVCLREFNVWIDMVEATIGLLDGIKVVPPEDFAWIDDGLHTADVSVVGTDGTRVPIIKGTMRGFGA